MSITAGSRISPGRTTCRRRRRSPRPPTGTVLGTGARDWSPPRVSSASDRNVHHSRVSDLPWPDPLQTTPPVPTAPYRDGFGNWCTRLVAPAGKFRVTSDAIINDSGAPDPIVSSAVQQVVPQLPEETLVFLLGSRYCETDKLSEFAWQRFSGTPFGWARVQAICDFVNQHIQFGYEFASSSKTAWDVFQERKGVCRDFAHLAVTPCRCMNIPARYCTGYLGDIGVPAAPFPMAFSAWFEAYLGNR